MNIYGIYNNMKFSIKNIENKDIEYIIKELNDIYWKSIGQENFYYDSNMVKKYKHIKTKNYKNIQLVFYNNSFFLENRNHFSSVISELKQLITTFESNENNIIKNNEDYNIESKIIDMIHSFNLMEKTMLYNMLTKFYKNN